MCIQQFRLLVKKIWPLILQALMCPFLLLFLKVYPKEAAVNPKEADRSLQPEYSRRPKGKANQCTTTAFSIRLREKKQALIFS